MNMSHIRSTNSKPEEIVRKYLFSKGLRYRKNVRTLPGKPDIVLRKYKTIIFVNGCFWHKHDCGRFVMPSSNIEYWTKKINGNVERDKSNTEQLEAQGWRVLTIWECQLKPKRLQATLASLAYMLNKIFLDDRKPKPYSIDDSETRMAAEAKEEYIERQAHK